MFDKLVSDISAVVADVKGGNWSQALADVGTTLVDAGPIVGLLTGGKFLAPAPEQTAKLQAACDELKACCDEHAKKCAAAPGEVGGIFPGDGSVLKAILALVMNLLPLIAPFLKPTPAPAT